MKRLPLTKKEIIQISDVIAYSIYMQYIDYEHYDGIEDEEAVKLTADDFNAILAKLNALSESV